MVATMDLYKHSYIIDMVYPWEYLEFVGIIFQIHISYSQIDDTLDVNN